eukprot:scaffold12726_cov148-Cylindrotheca_fusiformis.AAC.1
MSKASSIPGDWSITETSNGMSQFESSAGGSTMERVEYTVPDVAKREEKAVTRSKFLVFFALLLTVSGAAVATFLLTASQERNDFESAFAGLGSEVSTVARNKLDQIYSALDAYSTFISSQVEADPNTSWPYVLVRDFGLKSEKMLELVGLTSPNFAFLPIIHEEDREGWGSFVMESAPVYYQESLLYEGDNRTVEELMNITATYLYTHARDENFMFTGPIEVQRPGPILPYWQAYPLPQFAIGGLLPTGSDMLQFPDMANALPTTNLTLQPSTTFIQFYDSAPGENYGKVTVESQIMQPITENGKLVGVIILVLPWIDYFQNLYVDGLTDTIAVIRKLSYLINSTSAVFLGQLDAHDPKYDDLLVSRVILDVEVEESELPEGVCVPTLTLSLYPTEELEVSFQTPTPTLYTLVVVAIFFFTSLVFVLYDYFVGRRQRKFMARIKRQDQIVSNVFPAAIRDRLYEDEQKGSKQDNLLDPLGGGSGGAPLADLFLETTVVFADIAGFTAWSSAREPAQVFILLETIYGAFDKHAYRHSVFKVETVGDCYVAVAGLPEPDKDHAMSVCRFARDCVKTMKDTTLKLEVSLGPDTSELELRVGIHSGQVTAGVLRGERSRFQLFGDTMNTAARMESTSARNCIQVSECTADLLVAAGLSGWIAPRKSKILVKGKGEMQTYWLKTKAAKGSKPSKLKGDMTTLVETAELSDSVSESFDHDNVETMTKTERLVEWNVEALSPLLQQIVASRAEEEVPIDPSLSKKEATIGTCGTVLEEFIPIIPLKRFDAAELSKRRNTMSIDIGDEAKTQLRKYLFNVASMYQENPFHNFEHASHVTASVKKLLTRIVNLDDGNGLRTSSDEIDLVDMAGHSYGITSDPLTQFS